MCQRLVPEVILRPHSPTESPDSCSRQERKGAFTALLYRLLLGKQRKVFYIYSMRENKTQYLGYLSL